MRIYLQYYKDLSNLIMKLHKNRIVEEYISSKRPQNLSSFALNINGIVDLGSY